jgi:hypothetical protein
MPWPEKQRRAIFLDVSRRKGKAAAIRLMHEAGYGKRKKKRRRKKHRKV